VLFSLLPADGAAVPHTCGLKCSTKVLFSLLSANGAALPHTCVLKCSTKVRMCSSILHTDGAGLFHTFVLKCSTTVMLMALICFTSICHLLSCEPLTSSLGLCSIICWSACQPVCCVFVCRCGGEGRVRACVHVREGEGVCVRARMHATCIIAAFDVSHPGCVIV